MDEQPEPAASPPPPAVADEWQQIFDGLRQRYAGASDGVLFCIYKLQQNQDLKLRDFKAEAGLYRVPLSGRSYHSARVLLGLEPPTPPRLRKPPEASAEGPLGRLALAAEAAGEESPLIAALRRYQVEIASEMERLRAGVRQALEIVDDVLAEK